MRDTNSSLKWRRRKLAFTCLVIALCFALGNDLYRAKAIVIKNKDLFGGEKRVINYLDATKGRTVGAKFRSDLSQRFLIDPKREVQENLLHVLAGTDTCPGTVITSLPYNDAAGTTAGLTDNYNLPTDTTAPTLTGCASCTGVVGGGPPGAAPRGGVYTGTGTGPDSAYTISFNQTANLNVTMDPASADLTVIVYTSVCSSLLADAIVIDDDGLPGDAEDVVIGGMPAGTYNIVVDGYANESGAYTLAVTGSVQPSAPNVQHVLDTDGDGKTDQVATRAAGASSPLEWRLLEGAHQARPDGNGDDPEAGTTRGFIWGIGSDEIVPEDYDGDGKTDIAVWRGGAPNNSFFYIINSSNGTVTVSNFGQSGDDPSVVGDYDNDNKADVAIYRGGATAGAQSFWFYRGTNANPGNNITFIPWGMAGDFPGPGDYDGDGRNDFVTQRSDGGGVARFWMRFANGTINNAQTFGTPTDFIVPGDYDGDGKTDLAVVRGIGGNWNWFVRQSGSGSDSKFVVWGVSATDLPVQGDYDGDGKTDIAVYRPGTFLYRGTTSGARSIPFGAAGDYPAANYNTH